MKCRVESCHESAPNGKGRWVSRMTHGLCKFHLRRHQKGIPFNAPRRNSPGLGRDIEKRRISHRKWRLNNPERNKENKRRDQEKNGSRYKEKKRRKNLLGKRRTPWGPLRCPNCLKMFYTQRSPCDKPKYCSIECRNNGMKITNQKAGISGTTIKHIGYSLKVYFRRCVVCEKLFTARIITAKFCCAKCRTYSFNHRGGAKEYSNERQKKYYRENIVEIRETYNGIKKLDCRFLTDSYIKYNVLPRRGIKSKDVTPELVEMARERISVVRLLKQFYKEASNG